LQEEEEDNSPPIAWKIINSIKDSTGHIALVMGIKFRREDWE